MSNENPWAYNEARNRIREQKEREKVVVESVNEHFEKSQEKIRKKKKLDIFWLKHHIEAGRSLDGLKADIREALADGSISKETYDRALQDIDDRDEKEKLISNNLLQAVPFINTPFAQYLEKQPIGANIAIDLLGFVYGFVVQGSVILVIIAWKILVDLLRLPVDGYRAIRGEV